jgi:hypothetical protein
MGEENMTHHCKECGAELPETGCYFMVDKVERVRDRETGGYDNAPVVYSHFCEKHIPPRAEWDAIQKRMGQRFKTRFACIGQVGFGKGLSAKDVIKKMLIEHNSGRSVPPEPRAINQTVTRSEGGISSAD